MPSYDPREQNEIISIFANMLFEATKDGGRKRARGEKPSWKVDPDHLPALFSHLNKYFHGEKHDADSGAHPLVHLAWRALAIAYQEMQAELDNAPDAHSDAHGDVYSDVYTNMGESIF